VERNNKQTSVKLFAELSNSAKNAAPAPIASFVAKLLISFPPNQKIIVHPGNFVLLKRCCTSSPYNCNAPSIHDTYKKIYFDV
jgi:hypothetical protein